jgi:hypothetical protein
VPCLQSSDGVRRNFDRKQGAKGTHAPGEARKDGAVGEVDPTQFTGSVSEFVEQDAANVADANGDIVGDLILDVTPIAADPEDSKMTYDEYLAQKARVDDDVNRQTREVIVDEENFVKAKPFQKEEEATFFDSVKAAPKQRDEEAENKKKDKKKKVISLDEFVGVSGPVASTESGEREGSRGGRVRQTQRCIPADSSSSSRRLLVHVGRSAAQQYLSCLPHVSLVLCRAAVVAPSLLAVDAESHHTRTSETDRCR